MPKGVRKKKSAILVSCEFVCDDCGERFAEESENINWTANDEPCELCGSHGYIKAEVVCPSCMAHKTITIETW